MSNINPLRAEFVLTGLAFLAALTGLLRAVKSDLFYHIHLHDIEKLALPLTIGGIAAAYVFGIVVVQLTFFIPTESLMTKTRSSRLNDLHKLDKHIYKDKCINGKVHKESSQPDATATDITTTLLETAFKNEAQYKTKLRQWRHKDKPNAEIRHAQTLALTIGRAYAPAQLTAEYNYRRANRQVFVGMLPSVAMGALAGFIAVGPSLWLIPLVIVSSAVLFILWLSAKYQEEVAQSILLDIAFLRRWGIDTRIMDSEVNRPADS